MATRTVERHKEKRSDPFGGRPHRLQGVLHGLGFSAPERVRMSPRCEVLLEKGRVKAEAHLVGI